MRIAFVFIGMILAATSFSSSPQPCEANSSWLAAEKAFREKKFLIATIYYNRAQINNCQPTEEGQIRLKLAYSLLGLGEKELAIAELQNILIEKQSGRLTKQEAALGLIFEEQEPSLFLEVQIKDARAIWKNRKNLAQFNEAVISSSLSPANKLALQARQPAYGTEKSPLLAGISSALVPGLGQVYNGQLQTAALSLILNGLFFLSTRELAKEKLGFTAGISAVAFSTVYLGNIVSAVQGAKAKNESKYRQEDRSLQEDIRKVLATP